MYLCKKINYDTWKIRLGGPWYKTSPDKNSARHCHPKQEAEIRRIDGPGHPRAKKAVVELLPSGYKILTVKLQYHK
jgi:hypothetical protein